MLGINNIQINLAENFSKKASSSRSSCFFDDRKEIQDLTTHGCCRTIGLADFCVTRIRCTLERKKQDRFKVSENMVVLCFVLDGEVETNTPGMGSIKIGKGLHNICYMPSISGELRCPCGHFDAFYVGMPLVLFKSYLPNLPLTFNNFNQKTKGNKFAFLRKEHAHISHKIYRIIDDICTYKTDKQFQNLFIKAKIIELVSAQLEQLCTLPSAVSPINKETIDKMYIVRNFILNHLGDYYSLKDLAKKAGTNEHTLKKEFKKLFGETVFGFWSDAKMEKAQTMLLLDNKSINQVSEAVGYKNPQHFSTAFKKKFNMTPSIFKKINKQKIQ